MTAGLEAEHCAKCEKVVYEAEGLPAGNLNCSKSFAFTLVYRNQKPLKIFANSYKLIEIFISIGGVKYHKKCMKCATCNRKLDSRSFCIDKKEIFCTVCLKKNRLQESPKIYSDTTAIAPGEEKGCPRQVKQNFLRFSWAALLFCLSV